jgi:acetoin:2,6-dichlorophenolindophenol oxidoreductase subunit beta
MNAPAGQTLVMTYAQAAAQSLGAAMSEDASVVVLGEDIGRGGIFAQYKGLLDRFGAARVIDTPISESTIMGAAVGMALTGLKPVVELRVMDFAMCSMDEIINQAAKNRYMFGGQGRVPTVIRMPIGIWSSSAAQHSQSLEAWFTHVPGLVVVAPSNAQDNYSLLRSALACGDPVAYLEHKELWGESMPVNPTLAVPLGKAAIARAGREVTIVTWSKAVHWSLAAAELLAEGSDSGPALDVEVIDLRTLWPWDRDTVLSSVAKTGQVLVVHEAVQVAGFGAEIAAVIAQECPRSLTPKIARLGAPRVPVGYAPVLEAQARISPEKIVAAVRALAAR